MVSRSGGAARNPLVVAIGGGSGARHPQVRTSSIPLPGFPWSEAFSKTPRFESDLSGELLSENHLLVVALKTLRSFDFEGEFPAA